MTATTYNNEVSNPVFSNTNAVRVLGAVARAPEFKVNKGGKLMGRLTVAGEELIIDQEGKTRRIPFYEQVVYNGKRAETLKEMNLTAGDAVLLDGKFKQYAMTDADGVERKQLEIDYGKVRKAIGYSEANRTKDAAGSLRLEGGFCLAAAQGKVIGKGGELRYTQSGQAVFNFSINARASWKDANDTWQNDAAFIRVTVWGELAVELAQLEVAKGMEALVEGRPKRGKFERDGKTVYTLEIEAHRVVIAEGVESGGNGGGYSGGGLDALPDPFAGFGEEDDTPANQNEEDLPF